VEDLEAADDGRSPVSFYFSFVEDYSGGVLDVNTHDCFLFYSAKTIHI
jgi:hypothetical protein